MVQMLKVIFCVVAVLFLTSEGCYPGKHRHNNEYQLIKLIPYGAKPGYCECTGKDYCDCPPGCNCQAKAVVTLCPCTGNSVCTCPPGCNCQAKTHKKHKICHCTGKPVCTCPHGCNCQGADALAKVIFCPCTGNEICTCPEGCNCQAAAKAKAGYCPCTGNAVCTCPEGCNCQAAAKAKAGYCPCTGNAVCTCPEGCNCQAAAKAKAGYCPCTGKAVCTCPEGCNCQAAAKAKAGYCPCTGNAVCTCPVGCTCQAVPKCGPNEYWNDRLGLQPAEDTCAEPHKSLFQLVYRTAPGCVCKEGYKRNSKGQCVLPLECGDEYVRPAICPRTGRPGCFCHLLIPPDRQVK